MELSGETNKEGGGGIASARNVLSGSGPGSITLWGEYLDLVGGNVPEFVVSAHGLTYSDNSAEGKSVEGQDLAKRGSGEGS